MTWKRELRTPRGTSISAEGSSRPGTRRIAASTHRSAKAAIVCEGFAPIATYHPCSEAPLKSLRWFDLAAPCRSVSVRAEACVSKDAFEDEHPPAGHQMLQIIRQGLDPLLRLLLPVRDVDDLRDQHVIG